MVKSVNAKGRSDVPAVGSGGGQKALLAAVCDGVGGLSRGERASRRAAERLAEWAAEELPALLSREKEGEGGLLRRRFWLLIQEINAGIFAGNKRSGVSSGTTLSALLLWNGRYLIGHVGDSRIYAVGRQTNQLTEDHSWVAREVSAGRMTPEQAKNSAKQNVILRCVGAEETVEVQLREGELEEPTVFILCTDGFWHHIREEEWTEYFSPLRIMGRRSIPQGQNDAGKNGMGQYERKEEWNEAASAEKMLGEGLFCLTEEVKARGETDNITAIAIAAE